MIRAIVAITTEIVEHERVRACLGFYLIMLHDSAPRRAPSRLRPTCTMFMELRNYIPFHSADT